MLRQKLENKVWIPSVTHITAGITSRKLSGYEMIPNPAARHLRIAAARKPNPIAPISSPATMPRSSENHVNTRRNCGFSGNNPTATQYSLVKTPKNKT